MRSLKANIPGIAVKIARRVFRVKSPAHVARVVERLNLKVDVISFDVFDTLLRRVVFPPEKTKIPAARALSGLLLSRGRYVDVGQILALRTQVEIAQWQAAKAQGFDPEYHIHDVFSALLKHFLDEEEARLLVPRLVDEEISAEKWACRSEEGMVEAVRRLRELGKRVVFISDMYLGHDHVKELLDRNGFKGLFHRGYVSSEHKLSKRSGRLFVRMLEDQHAEPGQWIHFGDKITNDLLRPKFLGGKSYLYWPDHHETRITRLEHLALSEDHNGDCRVTLLMDACGFRNSDARGPAFDCGYTVFGPLIAHFVHRAALKIAENRIHTVVLDGVNSPVLQDVFKKMQVPECNDVRVVSCCIPDRMMNLMVPDWVGCLKKRVQKTSLRELFSQLFTDAEKFLPIARSCGFDSLDGTVESGSEWKLQVLLSHPEFRKSVLEQREYYRGLLRDYLRQQGIELNDTISIIALGPDTRFQESLQLACSYDSPGTGLHGHYLFLEENRREPGFQALGSRNHSPGWVTETAIGLLHGLTRPLHARPRELKRNLEGTVIPVCSEYRDDAVTNRDLAALQEGILAFADTYAQMSRFAKLPLTEEDTASFLNRFERFVRKPTTREARTVMNCLNENVCWRRGRMAITGGPSLIWAYDSFTSLFRKTLPM
jgi:predicted HAD superfamily hydrolase